MSGTPSREEIQEAAYDRPYHHLIRETGRGIPYISLLRMVRTALAPAAGERLLDAGCGDGRLLAELSGTEALLYGVDGSRAALRFAAGFAPRSLLSAQDLSSLAFASASFSKAALIETLEHLPPAAAERALEELARVLRPGGTLVVSVPTTRLPLEPKHYRHFTPDELRALLEKRFEIVSLTGRDRSSGLYRLLVAIVDNDLWHLRGGANRLLRWYFRRFVERAPLGRARGLVAVCLKR